MNLERKGLQATLLMPVAVPTIIAAALLIIGTVSNPEAAGNLFSSMLGWITQTFGWFYMLAVAIFLIFILVVGFSSWGNIRLGSDHAEPEYSFPAWFAMLFSAGYGIALLFFGVAEPVLHYSTPPAGAAETVPAAKEAMQIAYFHWGLHIWGIYGLMGLVLAYFAYRHGLPLSVRSALYPLIGDRIHGWAGHIVDTFAVLGTMFGLATTLGLSVSQINAGINYLWPAIPVSTTVQVIAIAVITLAATASVVAGMDKGIKNLSMLNMGLAVFLMAVVFAVGPSVHILNTLLQNTGAYLGGVVERTFNMQAYTHSDWIGNWTLFIFAWTIAWAPFVGLFIAKISRGRTIRQFVFGVLAVPTLFTFLWFAIFGDTALHLIMEQGKEALIGEVQSNHAVALFEFYDRLPMSFFLSIITVFLIITFFVTSSDSGSLVVDSLASGGLLETPVWQRVFWAFLEGGIAAALLLAGGLSALQTMTIVSALPFGIIMLLAVAGLWRALVIEGHREGSINAITPVRPHSNGGDWRKRLNGMMKFPGANKVEKYIEGVVTPALEEVSEELRSHGWDVRVSGATGEVSMSLVREGVDEFFYHADVHLSHGSLGYDLFGCSKEEVIRDLVDHLEQYLNFIEAAPGTLPWEPVNN